MTAVFQTLNSCLLPSAVATVLKSFQVQVMDFLVLAGNHHQGNANEVQLTLGNRFLAKKLICNVDSQAQSLRTQSELGNHFNEPIHQESSHGRRCESGLTFHVGFHTGQTLLFEKVFMHVFGAICNQMQLIFVSKIDVLRSAGKLVLGVFFCADAVVRPAKNWFVLSNAIASVSGRLLCDDQVGCISTG